MASKDYIEIFADCDLYIPTRTIYLGSATIDGEESGTSYRMFETAIKNLHILDNSGSGTINIIMDNPGGDYYRSKGIFGAIRGTKNFVRMMCYGMCMSAGSLILMAADERLMDPDCTFMMHYGHESYPEDHPLTHEKWVEFNKKQRTWMEDVYLSKINDKRRKDKKKLMSRKELQEMLKFDTILTAPECLSLGLIDRIVEHY